MNYRRRLFSIEAYEAITALVGWKTQGEKATIYLREDPTCMFKGVLKARIATVASLCYLETLVRKEGFAPSDLTFVYVRAAWTNNRITLPLRAWRVELEFSQGGYRKAKWAPVGAHEVAELCAELS